jgi:hypothetical protein
MVMMLRLRTKFSQRGSVILDGLFLVAVAGIVILVAAHRLAIADWVYFRSYQSSPTISQIASDAGFNDYGRKLFYREDPTLVERDVVDSQCGTHDLGCITERGHVFILINNNTGAEYDRVVVTAAHEMLHLAYRRLGKERQGVDQQLLAAQTTLANPELNQRMAEYNDPAERVDELHSILGSEYGDLPPGLESYYSRYFSDRSQTTRRDD